MDAKKILVIGSGTMGRGIAHVCALAGHTVVMTDVEQKQLDGAMALIGKFLTKAVDKGKITAEIKDAVLGRISTATDIGFAKEADMILEAVTEDEELKFRIYREIDELAPKHAIFGSNTSSIPITSLAAQTKRPEKVIGIHWMNPVPFMKLVEIVNGLETSDETLAEARELCESCGKQIIVCQKDYPGFIVNRICMPIINEAAWLYYDGMGTVEDIDKGIKLGLNHPMGPFELADFIGIDTCLNILNVLHDGYGDPKYRPCPILKQKVQAGHLGRKTRRGFYDYRK